MFNTRWNAPLLAVLAALLTSTATPAKAEVRWSISIGSHFQPWKPYGWGPLGHVRGHARHGWGPGLWYSAPVVTYVLVPQQQAAAESRPSSLLNDGLSGGTPSANPPSTGGELVLEARNGQSPLQTQRDRSACMLHASKQPQASETAVFQAALDACLQERGYAAR